MKRALAGNLGLALLCALAVVAARSTAVFLLGGMPHVMDEITYVFQAKTLATFHVRAPELLPRAAFNMWFIEDHGARYGIFPPGWPLVLAIFLRLGLAAWANPLLHGFTVFMVAQTGRIAGNRKTAALGALLYGFSPQALLLAGSAMSHTLVAACASVVLFVVVDALATREHARWQLLAVGVAVGLTSLTRPLCAVVLALWFLTSALFVLRGRERAAARLLRILLPVAGVTAAFLLGLLAYNRALTGSPLTFPQSAYFDAHLPPSNVPFFAYHPGCNALGFGPGHGCDHTVASGTHTFLNGLSNTGDNLTSWLLLVAGPMLVVAAVGAFVRPDTRRVAGWLVLPAALAIGLYMLYWHGGTCLGARFYQVGLPAVGVLIAVFLTPTNLRTGEDVIGARRILLIAGVVCALGWNVFAMRSAARETRDPRWGYWGTDDRYAALARDWDRGPALIMVAFGADDLENPELGWTAIVPGGSMWMLSIRAEAALAQNAPWVTREQVVFAKFHPALVDELRARFPERALWLYTDHADRGQDTLVPYDDTPWSTDGLRPYAKPVDNFDGFRVAPPRVPTPEGLRPDPPSDLRE